MGCRAMSGQRVSVTARASVLWSCALLLLLRAPLLVAQTPLPADPLTRWRGLIGEYGPESHSTSVRERDGQLLLRWRDSIEYPLLERSATTFIAVRDESRDSPRVQFVLRGARAVRLRAFGSTLPLRLSTGRDDAVFRLALRQPVAAYRTVALAAHPPVETGEALPSDLVELVTLDSTIRLDIRYATTRNFLSTPVYTQARAFLQRPAAEALVRAHRALARDGYGLLIHDGYRPWYVTRIFWDATPPGKREFVANPATGSKHNRGAAVDLTLYSRQTGEPVIMPGGYDEMSSRSYPAYTGGTSRQRALRDLLRRAMEAEGFTVDAAEWWHFDYRDWRRYRIGNQRFEDLAR
jgi:zinc D-Ala-D-Ala dipeptidase